MRIGRVAAAAVLPGLLAGAALWAGLTAGWLGEQRQAPRLAHCVLPAADTRAPYPGMVWVPPGRVTLGDTVYPEEQPLREVAVSGFWMDRTEVSNAEFARFVAATGYLTVAQRAPDRSRHPELHGEFTLPGAVVFTPPATVRDADPRQWWRYVPGASWLQPGGPGTSLTGRDAFPVVAVALEDAQAYARWVGHELPSEAEWEWAARGGLAMDPGDRRQPAQANTWQGLFPVVDDGTDGFRGLAPVGCFAPNGFGLYDMLGNVWEWTRDAYTDHPGGDNQPPDQPPAPARAGATADDRRVIKGGSWLCAPNYCLRYRPGARQPQEADLAASHLGFRTILRAGAP